MKNFKKKMEMNKIKKIFKKIFLWTPERNNIWILKKVVHWNSIENKTLLKFEFL